MSSLDTRQLFGSTANPSYESTVTNRIITWILVVCVALPFIIASFLQCIFVMKRRRMLRRERALAEVNENPGGRRMILELLFKENVKEVGEGELGEGKKKKKILVKKRRKKTEEERRLSNGEGREEGENNVTAVNVGESKKAKWLWWGEEKVRRGSTASDDHGLSLMEQDRVVVCISSDGLEANMDTIIGGANKAPVSPLEDFDQEVDEEMGMPVKETQVEVAAELTSVLSIDAIADDNNSSLAEILSPISNVTEPLESGFEEEGNTTDYDSANINLVKSEDTFKTALKSFDEESVAGKDGDVALAQCDIETPRAANCSEKLEPVSTERMPSSIFHSPNSLPDDEEFKMTTTVNLAPRIRSQRSLENSGEYPLVLEPPRFENVPGDDSPLSPCNENGEDVLVLGPTNNTTSRSPSLTLPDLDNEDTRNPQGSTSPPPIFRKRNSEQKLSDLDIHPSISNDTEVASNVDENSKGDPSRESILSQTAPADILPAYNFRKVESHMTDASSISYLTYEDVSIEDEESEMCAVCICPYEEGDIRVFSKHCSHVFHKECIFEWLVKGHNECPCCRKDMVTKSEIKETSESLIGTERLTHAMRTAMVEAPPFRPRRTPRLPRHMLMMARRESRRASSQRLDRPAMPPQSPNGHWLWTARHGSGESRSWAARGASGAHSAFTSAPAHTTTSPTNHGNNHNNDWLWTMRFDNMASQRSRDLRTVRSTDALDDNRRSLASRSSDAIDDNRPSGGALVSRSFDALESRRTSNTASSQRQPFLPQPAIAGSLVLGRNLHPNWGSVNNSPPPRHHANVTVSPLSHRLHPHWQQHQQNIARRGAGGPPLVEIPARVPSTPVNHHVASHS